MLPVVHAELVARLEPRHHFLDLVNIHQKRPVHTPEGVLVQVGLQIFDGAVVGMPLDVGGHQRNHTVVDGGVDHILRVHDEIAVRVPDQQLGAVRGTRAAAARRSSPSADTTRVGGQKIGQARNLKDLKTLECYYIIRRIGTIVLAKITSRVYNYFSRRYHAFNSTFNPTSCFRDFFHRVGGFAQHGGCHRSHCQRRPSDEYICFQFRASRSHWVRGCGFRLQIIAYGTSHHALVETLDQLQTERGVKADYLRLRAYPFTTEVHDFITAHQRVYIVDQNRD